MTSKPNSYRNASVLNLISQREQGNLSTSLYKENVTHIKVNQLPKFSERDQMQTDLGDSAYWSLLRSNHKGNLIGIGWSCKDYFRLRHSSICVFQFITCSSFCTKDVPFSTISFINKFSKKYKVLQSMKITDTADLYHRNQNPLLVVGTFRSGRSAAILTSYHCDHVYQELEWRVKDPILCCASVMDSVNFALGCLNGFHICKNLRLSKKYCLQEDVIAVEFSDDSNLLFVSGNQNGIQLCDMRENFENSRRNLLNFVKGPVTDMTLIASRLKLLKDQVSLIVSDEAGYISKIDLRMKKPMFNYPEHKSHLHHRPLDVNEDLDLLCAVGSDHYCRIWSLSSGKLHWADKVEPTIYKRQPYPSHACIVSSERRWFVATFQNDIIIPIVPDETKMVALRPSTVLHWRH